MNNKKVQQREQLILEFGILIQPFVELVKRSELPRIMDYRIACAKVQAGDPAWRQTARAYCLFANDIFMNTEFQKISHVNERFLREMSSLINNPEKSINLVNLQLLCEEELNKLQRNFKSYISEIPIEWEPEIFPANTPFTSYLRIKESLSLASERIHYFDRYLKIDFFEIFLRDIDRDLEIRLITTVGDKNYGIKGVQAISNLARQEFSNYRLIEVHWKDIHDRNLRVDDNLFNLGPGVDRAGIALTNFSPADSSPKALSHLNAIIETGTIVHHS